MKTNNRIAFNGDSNDYWIRRSEALSFRLKIRRLFAGFAVLTIRSQTILLLLFLFRCLLNHNECVYEIFRCVESSQRRNQVERVSERTARTRACTKRLRVELKRVRVSDGSSGVLSCSEIRRLNLNGATTRRLSPCVV